MNTVIQMIVKIIVVFLSLSGMSFYISVLAKKLSGVPLKKIKPECAYIIIDINKSGEDTDVLVNYLNSEVRHIDKIFLYNGDIAALFDTAVAEKDNDELKKMCKIITCAHPNVFLID